MNPAKPTSGHGDPDVAARFWAKVVEGANGCWVWTSAIVNGYGQFWDSERHIKAHRWAYEEMVAEVPATISLDHLCRNKCCVNPDHLEPVPSAVNIGRGNPRWKQSKARTHCKRGHAYTQANTYDTPQTGRRCRACQAAARRRYVAARKKVAA